MGARCGGVGEEAGEEGGNKEQGNNSEKGKLRIRKTPKVVLAAAVAAAL